MLIFVENITSRLTYTLDFIFKERDLNYELTLDKKYFFRLKFLQNSIIQEKHLMKVLFL